VTFLAAVVALIWGLVQAITLLWVAGIALLIGFFVLVWYHNQVGRVRRRDEELFKINDEAIMRVERRWDDLPLRHKVRAEPGDPYAGDLDIFGKASLMHLLETVGTFMGESTLARWLQTPAPPERVRDRQSAVKELAPLIDLRDELTLRGRLMGDEKPDPAPFLTWAESKPLLARRQWLPWVSVASVFLLWGLAFAQLFGLINYPFWFLVAAANFIFTMTTGRQIYGTISKASAGEQGFKHYANSFELLSGAKFESHEMARLQSALTVEGVPAHGALRRLHRITTFSIPMGSQLYFPIQAVTLWDVHLLGAVERWQRENGKYARRWLETLGEAEALAALAGLSHANPDWAFPSVEHEADRLQATALGHPLLGDERVTNSVEVGPPGTFLLVTGSNMSGKSTLLRAMGVNIVLAQAGGPVCAGTMQMPPLALWSSMRVEDSLARGVSYFMAELQRLKQVVDAARTVHSKGEMRLFYLLDEILQGTNTSERQIAARQVIMYLVKQGALGAVSTHDLTLAEIPQIAEAARLVHFTETIHDSATGPQMTFDYKLRPGLATSTNALKLMEIVGLDFDD
jgi:hypothetical protein